MDVVIKFEDPAAAAVENRVVLRRELKLFYANLVGALLVLVRMPANNVKPGKGGRGEAYVRLGFRWGFYGIFCAARSKKRDRWQADAGAPPLCKGKFEGQLFEVFES